MITYACFNEHDKKAVEELVKFIPGKIFDFHAHVYREKDLNKSTGRNIFIGHDVVEAETWLKNLTKILGREPRGALFMPFPTEKCDIDAANNYLVTQLAQFKESKGLVLVSPTHRKDLILKHLENPQVVGFKPYHLFSSYKPTFDSTIDDYIPDWVWEEANKRNLVIMLHLVKNRALADVDNQRIIREKCKKYPQVKLILAHAARGFNAVNTLRGIGSLRGLENIWFDTSAICEASPIKAILNEFGPTRVLWGSDFPISQTRGKCISLGDGFIWIQEGTTSFEKLATPCNPILVVIESIRALKCAADDFGLNYADIEDIFYNNAVNLLEKVKKDGNAESASLGRLQNIENTGNASCPANSGSMENVTSIKTQALYLQAKKIIPGGVQLLSKRPEMMAPGVWPPYFREARGCEVWDLDGRHYYDMSTNGIGSCLLGYRDPDVTRAVIRRINLGSMSTLNPPEEVCLAGKLLEIHPWAEQVRFARTGGEIGAVAVRIARATTDRSVITISGYHGWHDWYLAANLGEDDALRGHLLLGLDPLGAPRELRKTAVTFKHGDFDEFRKVLDEYGDGLAAVIMEPCRYKDPKNGFLEYVRSETAKRGIILIFDEVTIGWRLNLGGSHLRFGVNPDMAIFAKALGNGHPIAAVIGTKEAMQGAHGSFISSTYWTESVGPAAALAVIDKLEKYDVAGHVAGIGSKIMYLWKQYGGKYDLPVIVEDGYPCLAHFKFDHELSQHLNTLYVQLMLERGFLAGVSIYPTFAHTEEIVDLYGNAIDEVFGIIAGCLKENAVGKMLKGPVAHTGFRRLL
ncbi:MAG: aminotransferase class III-fold pyridoxal phosphate-dependent enzyme [Clostridiaceae bacterium]|nr:aminotransferase class III-fold pyridoxal phosphate-dependent enzyme [Clostridiaceae bacterium]